jgi:GntR family transcriptional regulator/MocR family aminotransferase
VLPAHLVDAVTDAKAVTDGQTSSLEQLTLAEFIASGAYDRHVRRGRLDYRRRRDRLIDALAVHAPEVRLTGIAAGLHAVAELPGDQPEHQVIARAAARGVAIEGLGGYALRDHASADASTPASGQATGHTRGPALVIGYAAPPGHAYSTALARLTAAIRDQ